MERIPPLMPHCLDDAPLDEVGHDGARNKDVTETLAKLFIEHANTPANKYRIRIGLFGGLGQGKTSVWKTAAKQIDHDMRKRCYGDWYQTFDTAEHKQDALEHDLDRLLTASRPVILDMVGAILPWLFRLIYLTVITGLLGTFILSTTDILADQSSHLSGVIPKINGITLSPRLLAWIAIIQLVALSSLSIIKAIWAGIGQQWFRDQERKTFFNRTKSRFYFFRRPPWLIIDNLDRASDAQQRAVLRALYKHGHELKFSVLVCMDESRLLLSDPAPESPVELLTKAIQLEIRMPGRVPLDACRLAWQMASTHWPAHTRAECWQTLLADPRIVAGLARGLVLSHAISPRYAKRLLNDTNHLHWQLARQRANNRLTAGSAQLADIQREIASGDDWLAALRVVMLTQAHPALRNDNQQFARVLMANSESAFADFLTKIPNAPAENITLSQKAIRIFAATRHWQPRHGEWLPLVAIAQLPRGLIQEQHETWPATENLAEAPPPFPIFDHTWRCLQAVGNGYGTDLPESLAQDFTTISKKTKWSDIYPAHRHAMMQSLMLAADMYCLLAENAPAALRAVSLLIPWEASPQAYLWTNTLKPATLMQMLWPSLAARSDIGNALNTASASAWLQACNNPDLRLAIASLLPPDLLGREDRLAIAAEPERKKLDEAVANFCSVQPPNPAPARLWPWSNQVGIDKHIGRYWPALSPHDPNLFAKLAEQLNWWREYFVGKLPGGALPASLHYLLFEDPLFYQRLKKNSADGFALFRAFTSLFARPGSTDQWQLDLWQQICSSVKDMNGKRNRLLLKRVALPLDMRWADKSISHNSHDRILIRLLLAASISRMRLIEMALHHTPPSLAAATLLKTHIEQQPWVEKVDDATWLRLFGAWLGESVLDQRSLILVMSERSDNPRYVASRDKIHKYANGRPALVVNAIKTLIAEAQMANRTLTTRRCYLSDAIYLKDNKLPPNVVLDPDTTIALQHCGDNLDQQPKWSTFNEFINDAPTNDPDAYENWLYSGADLVGHGLETESNPQRRYETITRRIGVCLELAPAEVNADLRTDYAEFLRAQSTIFN
jgi:hypothetical protein